MTRLDRLVAAISDDSPVTPEEQAALVEEMLARRVSQATCLNCLQAFADGYCDGCGRMQHGTGAHA